MAFRSLHFQQTAKGHLTKVAQVVLFKVILVKSVEFNMKVPVCLAPTGSYRPEGAADHSPGQSFLKACTEAKLAWTLSCR